ncbi:zinc-binding dehydrogenase [Bacteroidota bacterium]
MKAVFLTQYGDSTSSFQIHETQTPEPKGTEILVKVETFGLNFADVVARRGMYGEAPKPPCILGYEVVGRIEKIGPEVTQLKPGEKVVSLTRFGGYAEYAISDEMASVVIPESMDNGEACSLATQYIAAYYSAFILANLQQGDHVLIHAAAGGVGIALNQLAKIRGCITYGTSSSKEKIAFLKNSGLNFPINYNETDFAEEVFKLRGEDKIDVIFDPIGGKNFKKSKSVLAKGGRLVIYGASDQLKGKKGMINNLRLLFGFGFLTPIALMMGSKSILGVNLLRIAEHRPDIINRCMNELLELHLSGKIKPFIGATFSADQIGEAHDLLESGKSMGKIIINWN